MGLEKAVLVNKVNLQGKSGIEIYNTLDKKIRDDSLRGDLIKTFTNGNIKAGERLRHKLRLIEYLIRDIKNLSLELENQINQNQ